MAPSDSTPSPKEENKLIQGEYIIGKVHLDDLDVLDTLCSIHKPYKRQSTQSHSHFAGTSQDSGLGGSTNDVIVFGASGKYSKWQPKK